MGQLDKKIFGKKKFSDILEEIYNNQKKKEEQISTLISELYRGCYFDRSSSKRVLRNIC